MTPLMCTQNSLFHIDYGIPLLASKSTDYRTSTGKNHDFVPSIAQDFDCRVKANIKPELLDRDIALRNEVKSTYCVEYPKKHSENDMNNGKARRCNKIDFIRTVEEKIFMDPPAPKPPKISEMKESYSFNYRKPTRDKIVNFKCTIPETYRAVQPDINPAEKGFYKHLDIYLTENRSKYVSYTEEQLAKAQEDLITIYNASGKHKGLKDELPGKICGTERVYDRTTFRVEHNNRILSSAPKRVPNSGMTSEYQTNYHNSAYSDFYPYIQTHGIYFPESLSKSGPWQDLAPPAMYFSEYSHIGNEWPVRAVVDINSPSKSKEIVHSELCCTKIEK